MSNRRLHYNRSGWKTEGLSEKSPQGRGSGVETEPVQTLAVAQDTGRSHEGKGVGRRGAGGVDRAALDDALQK